MFETVKTIKGHNVVRMIGTHGFYHVNMGEGKYCTFKTIKSAVEFINRVF